MTPLCITGLTSPEETFQASPLHLSNALAACVLSARLHSEHRQWAAQQLVLTLAARGSHRPKDMVVDLIGDMPTCPTSKLEAHQHRVTACVYNAKNGLLASWCVSFSLLLFDSPHAVGDLKKSNIGF